MTFAASAIDAPRAGGLWRRLGWSLWPPRCLICGETGADGRDLCPICAAAWPWMGTACLACALPLAAPAALAERMSHIVGSVDGADHRETSARIGDDNALTHGPPHAWPEAAANAGAGAGAGAASIAPICGHCLRRPRLLSEVHAACIYRAPLDQLLPRFKFHRDLAAGRLLATMMARAIAAKFESGGSHRFDDVNNATRAPATTTPCIPASGADPLESHTADSGSHTGDDTGHSSRTYSPINAPITASSTTPILIPIPLHRARLRERGYDQALELARPLARELRLPLLDDALLRLRNTPAQSRLDAAHRRRNLRDAFAWRSAAAIPAHVVLIDDVMTTGATLHAAARTLRRAGVLRVDAWVCARVL
jgi:predicted amidophosphoribosyltransferase